MHHFAFMPKVAKPRKRMKFPVNADFETLPLSEAPDDGSVDSEASEAETVVQPVMDKMVEDRAPPTPPLTLAEAAESDQGGHTSSRRSRTELGSDLGISAQKLASSRCCAWHLFSEGGVTNDQFAECPKKSAFTSWM